MREGDLSGTEHNVQIGDVAQDTTESSLKEQGEVSVVVDHTLLRDRESTGLANHKIGPLHAHDRN